MVGGPQGRRRGRKPLSAVLTTHDRREHESREATPEALLRDAMGMLDRCGVTRSAGWVSRTVRAYLHRAAPKGYPFGAYLLNRVQLNSEERARVRNDPALASVLAYRDPTGETAVRRAMRGGGSDG